MSIITGSEIKRLVEKRKITIKHFDERQLNPNSYNVRLSRVLKVYDCDELDSEKQNPTKEIIIPDEGYVLQPGELYLGSTLEYTETKVYNMLPKWLTDIKILKPITDKFNRGLVIAIDGRSSTARLGITCHIAAGYGDVGFRGTFTCEITCTKPVKIYPHMQIGQLYYTTTKGDLDRIYHGKYQGQVDATESRFYIDVKN